MSWLQVAIETEVAEEIENFVSYRLQNCENLFKLKIISIFNLLISVISDFGGLLGLFMGCSLLSIIEIFYYLINHVILIIKTKRKAKKSASQTGPQTWAIRTNQVKLVTSQVTNNEILATFNSLTRTVYTNDLKIRKMIMEKQSLIEKRLSNLEEKLEEEKSILSCS
jgi:Amiloride-sensitive sodium channel